MNDTLSPGVLLFLLAAPLVVSSISLSAVMMGFRSSSRLMGLLSAKLDAQAAQSDKRMTEIKEGIVVLLDRSTRNPN